MKPTQEQLIAGEPPIPTPEYRTAQVKMVWPPSFKARAMAYAEQQGLSLSELGLRLFRERMERRAA
jgi:hypothetical protein